MPRKCFLFIIIELVDTTKNGKLIDIIHKKTRVCVKIKKKENI